MSRAARLGAFIVVTLAILVAGVFIIGSKRYLFSSTYQLKAQFDNVAGLAVGGDVRTGGVHIGTVRQIVLPRKPGERITVVIDLRQSTREIIKQDSVASIETEGMLGSQYLAITIGSAGKADVRDGDTIASQPPLEMADLLEKTSAILDRSQAAIQNVTRATVDLASITGKIDGGRGTIGALVNDKQLYTNLEQTTSALHATMSHAQEGVTDFKENMEALKHNFFLRGYFKSRGYEDSAELAKNGIEKLPAGAPMKEFAYPAKQLFDTQTSAKLKNQKSLGAGGEFLASNQFGLAVVVAATGMEGDTQKNQVLTEARAMVVREYLVENFGFDDTGLKTLGMGKQEDTSSGGGWGTVRILIYPVGTETPPNKQTEAGAADRAAPKTNSTKPVQGTAATTPAQP